MDMANQFLSLSLFIMLLSFFIILNTMSNYDDVKARPVLQSLSSTFSNDSPEEVFSPNTVESTAMAMKDGDTLSRLDALFNAQITGVDVQENRLGTTMYMRMKFSDFERGLLQPDNTWVRGFGEDYKEPGAFRPVLISLLQSSELSIPYRMDMVLNISDDDARNKGQLLTPKARGALQDIALLTSQLEQSGLEKKMMSAGLAVGDPGMIDIYFRPYIAFNPVKSTPTASEGGL